MKKTLTFASLFFLLSTNVIAASFPDVPEDHKNYKAIEFLDEKQIVKGYADGTFGPDKLVSRAEALKMIIVALGVKHDENYEVLFPDVKKEEWFFEFVMAAKKLGIVSGYQDGKFKPSDTVNLSENLKMLLTAAKVELPKEITESVFVDVAKDAWYAIYVLYSRNQNMLFSDDFGRVHPDQAMTRAAFAELIYRLMVIKEKNGQPYPLDLSWGEYVSSVVPFKIKYDQKALKVVENKNEVAFFRPDKQFLQFSANRIYPNSAVVKVTLDKNESTLVEDQYFNNIKAAFPGAKYKKFKVKDLNALEVLYESERTVDWYIYLKNGQVLVVYTEYGSGTLGYQLQQTIKAMLATLEYKELPPPGEDYSQLLSEILAIVLVEGKGMENLNKLPEKTIFETDTIGVGTGPVDYYYSVKLDYTFKYERSTDVILDTRKGKTSAF